MSAFAHLTKRDLIHNLTTIHPEWKGTRITKLKLAQLWAIFYKEQEIRELKRKQHQLVQFL